MAPTPPGTGPLDPGLSGIDPGLMDGFIAAMTRAHAVMGEQSQAIRDQFGRVGLGASALSPVRRVEDWTGEQLPDCAYAWSGSANAFPTGGRWPRIRGWWRTTRGWCRTPRPRSPAARAPRSPASTGATTRTPRARCTPRS
ncbi:hypothetical protein ACFQYP_61210 [Nonomuraea antimicrobica]